VAWRGGRLHRTVAAGAAAQSTAISDLALWRLGRARARRPLPMMTLIQALSGS
jgi:hypothetical protein